ncbi:hypothetical protein CVU37_12420 [candidate division BRC1 bacterium HGW-BRC1-1]|nr:MAG: hypothetical protein CVU37_12420 [candidate division BRC1 bacterium HGW-BRC1-1]
MKNSANTALEWVQRVMMRNPDGSEGVWERIRIDLDEIQPWVRPDCCSEAAMTFFLRSANDPDSIDRKIAVNLLTYVLRRQTLRGGFPFYEWAPRDITQADPDKTCGAQLHWPNDQGKTLEILATLAPHFPELPLTEAARKLGDFFLATQTEAGSWSIDGTDYPGTCFTPWAACGLSALFALTHEEKYRSAAVRAIQNLQANQLPGGRIKTTFEINQMENWRPASSEAAEALKAFAVANKHLGIDTSQSAEKCARFLLSLQHESGAILNCDASCMEASEQRSDRLTDLVYTDGYALQALQVAGKVFDRPDWLAAADRLAEFLMAVQCRDENPKWDGAWRGSYHVDLKQWHGRADQQNPLDEGGMYSVYTGWSVFPITSGLLIASGCALPVTNH